MESDKLSPGLWLVEKTSSSRSITLLSEKNDLLNPQLPLHLHSELQDFVFHYQRTSTLSSLIANKKGYAPDMLRKFYEYWTESNQSPSSKLKFEKQTTWDLAARLRRWSNNGFDDEGENKEPVYSAPKNNYD